MHLGLKNDIKSWLNLKILHNRTCCYIVDHTFFLLSLFLHLFYSLPSLILPPPYLLCPPFPPSPPSRWSTLQGLSRGGGRTNLGSPDMKSVVVVCPFLCWAKPNNWIVDDDVANAGKDIDDDLAGKKPGTWEGFKDRQIIYERKRHRGSFGHPKKKTLTIEPTSIHKHLLTPLTTPHKRSTRRWTLKHTLSHLRLVIS